MTDITQEIEAILINCYGSNWATEDAIEELNTLIDQKVKAELEQTIRVGLPYAQIRIKELEK